MWCFLISVSLLPTALTTENLFNRNNIIFRSDYNITKLLVPPHGKDGASSDIPLVFFTVTDPSMKDGSSIFVLVGLVAYEILPGGRDITTDFSSDKSVYLATSNAIYKYDADSISANVQVLQNIFNDDNIIQMQKATGTKAFYVLTEKHEIFKIGPNIGPMKISTVKCASEFVLDTSNNIYYIACKHKIVHIIRNTGRYRNIALQYLENFDDVKLLRPAYIMENSIPIFGDGVLYILYLNGTSYKTDFMLNERPTAYGVDAALYLVAALNGKIYEFNVTEVLNTSVFGFIYEWPRLPKTNLEASTPKQTIYSYYIRSKYNIM